MPDHAVTDRTIVGSTSEVVCKTLPRACCPYHLALHRLQLDHPTTQVIAFGDDTYACDESGRLAAWRSAKELMCVPLGHAARHDKEAAWSPEGDMAHTPANLPGSPSHPAGRLPGYKGVGCFFGSTVAGWA